MKKLLLAGIAALFLATVTAHADTLEQRCTKLVGEVRETPGKHAAYQRCMHPEYLYADKDYMIDCQSYRWKWEKHRPGYKRLADACVFRSCRGNPPEICADGNWGPVPRKLRKQQLRDLGRVPSWRRVTKEPAPWESDK